MFKSILPFSETYRFKEKEEKYMVVRGLIPPSKKKRTWHFKPVQVIEKDKLLIVEPETQDDVYNKLIDLFKKSKPPKGLNYLVLFDLITSALEFCSDFVYSILVERSKTGRPFLDFYCFDITDTGVVDSVIQYSEIQGVPELVILYNFPTGEMLEVAKKNLWELKQKFGSFYFFLFQKESKNPLADFIRLYKVPIQRVFYV